MNHRTRPGSHLSIARGQRPRGPSLGGFGCLALSFVLGAGCNVPDPPPLTHVPDGGGGGDDGAVA